MSAPRLARSLILVPLLLVVSAKEPARADARPTLGHAPGVLAARQGDGPWRLVHPGEPLPGQAQLTTAAAGPCLVHLDEGVLHLAPESDLRIDAPARSIAVTSGRALVDVSGKRRWVVRAGEVSAAVASGSAVEVAAAAGAEPSMCVVHGEARVTRSGQSHDVEGPATVSWKEGAKGPTIGGLTRSEEQRITDWTASKTRPQGLGQLVIKDPQSDSPVRLNVARYHVHVVIDPPVALVQIDQSFYNPYGTQEEGQFVFNLPRGASVSRFAMYTAPTRLVEGELIERDRAANIYQTIVNRRRDPAILEQIGDSLFKMRVFPIFARDTKRILLDFTVPVESHREACHFRLPLFSDLEPIWDFELSGVIRDAEAETVASASHPEIELDARPDGSVAFALKRSNYKPRTDLALSFWQKTGEPRLRSYLAEPIPVPLDDDGRPIRDAFSGRPAMYFVAEVPARRLQEKPRAPTAADVLILADTSSSMKDLAAVRRQVGQIIARLGPEDRFRLVSADVVVRPMHPDWIKPGTRQAHAALEALDEQFALGGTDLLGCVQKAVESFQDGTGRRRLVIYVGDGHDEVTGTVAADSLARDQIQPAFVDLHQAQSAFFGVRVLRGPDGIELLEHLANESGGKCFDLVGGGSGPRDLFAWLLAGLPTPERIAEVKVEDAAGEDLYYSAARMPDEPLTVFGRMAPADRVALRIASGRGDETKETKVVLEVPQGQDDVFAGRLWAQKRLDQLRSTVFDDEAIQNRIVGLSREWSLLSPYTAFLVLETEKEYATWGIDRRARRRYWKPADTRPQAPLPPEWLASVTPKEQARPGPRAWDEKHFNKALQDARRALATGDAGLAYGLLKTHEKSPLARRSPEFQRLMGEARSIVHAQWLRESLGTGGGLPDPGAARTLLDLRPSALPLLSAGYRTSPQFARRHPNAEKLLGPVSIESVTSLRNLEELAAMLRDATGTNVVLDRRALEDGGIAPGAEGDRGALVFGKTSLRSAVKLSLRQWDLTLVEQPHRLLITTPEQAECMLFSEIYPVADLLYTDRVAEPGWMVDPFHDRAEAARHRIAKALKRPISVSFEKCPLHEVVAELARQLDDALVVDRRALDDVGIGTEAPVTANYRDVPAREALRWILQEVDLTYVFRDEALVITTPEEAELYLELRLHSGRGVVYEYPAPAWQARGGFGALGGMGFGGGLGGGFGRMGDVGIGGGFGMGGGGAAVPGGMAFFDPNALAFGAHSPFAVSVIPVIDGGTPAGVDPRWAEEPALGAAAGEAPISGRDLRLAGAEADFDSPIDMITSTITPTAWDDVGGPGSIAYFPYTLDFVLAQTWDVHEQIEALLGKLRRVPAVESSERGARPARLPRVTPETSAPDFDTLIDMITFVVAPSTWDNVGGPGVIAPDYPRVALIVSQTQAVHDELWRLLVMLRRSRYELVRGSRPWEASLEGEGLAATTQAAFSPGERRSALPPAKPKELKLLRARRTPAGQWTWRRGEPGPERDQTLTVRCGDGRLEMVFPHLTARIEGDEAAVAWPGLLLVEHAMLGEPIRRAADAFLPWMPHRTNEELARLFEVREAPAGKDTPGADKAGEHNSVVRLRWIPAGLSTASETYVEAAFSKATGLPVAWESYVEGMLAGRLRFEGRAGTKGPARRQRVVLSDPDGAELASWELETAKPSARIAELTEGWEGYVHLDRRAEKAAIDPDLRAALAAVQAMEWARAVGHLNRLAEDHPEHPLVQVLYAWCFEREPALGDREHMLALLRKVAASRATALARLVAEGHFRTLRPEELYAILSAMPESRRSAEDEDRLAAAARAAGRLKEALAHAQAAIAKVDSSRGSGPRHRTLVELHLKLGQAEAARAAARKWASAEDRAAEDLAVMAELLARYAQAQPADDLFAKALAERKLARKERYRLMKRWAETSQGVPRWQRLVEAAELAQAGSEERRACLDALLAELQGAARAEVAAQLAAATGCRDLKAALLLRQAELARDQDVASDLAWRVYCMGQLDEERLAWADRLWSAADQPRRTIEACEAVLRGGKRLPGSAAIGLARAYRAVGRRADAQRALTRDAEPAPPAPAAPRGGRGGGFF